MAEVVITEKVTETVTHTVSRVKALKCDVCGKEFTGKYWDLTTQHHDWGNDSCESLESFDLCSKECVQKKLDEYFKDCEHSDTQEFHLEQDYFKEFKRGVAMEEYINKKQLDRKFIIEMLAPSTTTIFDAKDIIDKLQPADVIERSKFNKAIEQAYKVRKEVLHSNKTYEPNDVLEIIDEITACFEEV